MPLPVWVVLWISLALLLLSVTLGAVYCFRAGRALWRDIATFTSALDAVAVALPDSRASAVPVTAAAPIDAAVARLRTSWRRWTVLRTAVADVRAPLVAVYPRK